MDDPYPAKTKVLRLSVSQVILACVVLTKYQSVTNGQTDRQSDITTMTIVA